MSSPAEQIKEARARLGLSQARTAERIGVPRRTLEDWEAGRRTPKPLMLGAVLRELEQARP